MKLGLHSLLTENFIEKQIEAIFLHDFFLLQLRLRNPICLLLVFVFSFSERNYIWSLVFISQITDEKEENQNITVDGKFSFENDSHLRTVFDALNEQRNSTRFCDAVLKVGEREIRGHRSILVAAVPKILDRQVKKGDTEFIVDLEGLDPNAVEVLVEFVYTGKLLVTSDGVLNLFQAAKSLGMKQVQDSSEKFILEKILPLNWIALRSFAEGNDCPNLMTAIDEFIAHNVEDIFHKKDFFQLPRLQIELATTNNRPEENIDPVNLCQMALTWAQKQLEVRNKSRRRFYIHLWALPSPVAFWQQRSFLLWTFIDNLNSAL